MHERRGRQSPLRLVGSDGTGIDPQAAHDVARENREAAINPTLDPTDPRWVLAVRTASQLEGSLLTPERRSRLLTTARRLGIRPFEANVIMAIVQEQARRGQPPGSAAETLALLEDSSVDEEERSPMVQLVIAIMLAIVINAFLIWWLLGS